MIFSLTYQELLLSIFETFSKFLNLWILFHYLQNSPNSRHFHQSRPNRPTAKTDNLAISVTIGSLRVKLDGPNGCLKTGPMDHIWTVFSNESEAMTNHLHQWLSVQFDSWAMSHGRPHVNESTFTTVHFGPDSDFYIFVLSELPVSLTEHHQFRVILHFGI